MSRLIKKVKSLFESSYDDLLCPNCNHPFPRWRTSYMDKCRQCGTCVTIQVTDPIFTVRNLLFFLPMVTSLVGSDLVATEKPDRFIAAALIYLVTSGILYWVIKFIFKTDLKRPYEQKATIIPNSQYNEQHVPVKTFLIIVVSTIAILIAVYWLMIIGLRYSPLGNLP